MLPRAQPPSRPSTSLSLASQPIKHENIKYDKNLSFKDAKKDLIEDFEKSINELKAIKINKSDFFKKAIKNRKKKKNMKVKEIMLIFKEKNMN